MTVRILETTVRDGGYIFKHHYSRADIASIAGGLDQAGLPLIEIGHGNGMGSHLFHESVRDRSMPRITDAEHAEVANRVVSGAKVGAIFTAGPLFVPIEYLDQIAAMGLSFVRLAFMPSGLDESAMAYVRRASDLGLTVAVNLTQTYACPLDAVAKAAAMSADNGANWFYVVDSAGGMSTDDIKRYVAVVADLDRVEVGLHAHNNLGYAVRNCLAAIDAGATLVDSTLNGMGRSTGNPPTEALVAALRGKGMARDIDLDRLVGLGRAVRSLMGDAGNDPFDVVSGGALVHSRNVPQARSAAAARGRSLASFLMEVGREARERGVISDPKYSDAVLDAAAEKSATATEIEPAPEVVDVVGEHILAGWVGGISHALLELRRRKNQHHKASVVQLSRDAAAYCTTPVPWESTLVGVTIPWTSELPEIATLDAPDFLLLDEGDETPPWQPTKATLRLPFAELFADAVRELVFGLRSLGVTPVYGDDDPAIRRWVGSAELADFSDKLPDGAVAVLAGGSDIDAQRLRSHDYVVLTTPWQRERLAPIRKAGARVVSPRWTNTVADAVARLVALRTAISDGKPNATLVQTPFVPATGQALWDAEHATLIDSEEPEISAKLAAASYTRAVWRGTRRF